MKSIATLAIILCSWLLNTTMANAGDVSPSTVGTIATTPYSSCRNHLEAEQDAQSLAESAARRHCRQQGYGWRAAHLTRLGKLSCTACGTGQFSCAYLRVELECRQSKTLAGWLDRVGW